MYEITYLNIDENTEYEKTVKKVLEKSKAFFIPI